MFARIAVLIDPELLVLQIYITFIIIVVMFESHTVSDDSNMGRDTSSSIMDANINLINAKMEGLHSIRA